METIQQAPAVLHMDPALSGGGGCGGQSTSGAGVSPRTMLDRRPEGIVTGPAAGATAVSQPHGERALRRIQQ